MITKIEVENFKSILAGSSEVKSLNIYTGINSSGKSTFLQTLILLRQSYTNGTFFRKPASLFLGDKDRLLNLGTFKDILCHHASKDYERIKINIAFHNQTIEFRSDQYGVDNKIFTNIPGSLNKSILDLETESLFTQRFQYLSADRIQPAEDYPRSQEGETLGKRGEYTADYIQKFRDQDISIKGLSLHGSPASYSLLHQLNDWMNEISRSVLVDAYENLSTNRVELSFRYKNSDSTPSLDQKPQNVGYGITHTLPIVVSILSARVGDIIIIENPETHLHPSAQARLGRLFCLAATHGVQLFIETHSDHIINGVRVSVKKQIIAPEKIVVNYFSKDERSLTKIDRIKVQPEGGMEEWPEGFFDEWDNQLTELL